MKQIYMQQTVNHMFEMDPGGSQKMFEEMGDKVEIKEIELKDGTIVRYYVYKI